MVNRSIAFKIYLYVLGALLGLFVLALVIGRILVYEGRLEALDQLRSDHALAIGARYELALADGRLGPNEERRIHRQLRLAQVRFVPWEHAAYPRLLDSEKMINDKRPLTWWEAYWVRVDVAGQPVGAVHVEFNPFKSHPRMPMLRVALIWIVVTGLVLIPPLFFLVIRPLRRMGGVAHRLGEGDLATPVAIDRRDEFGELQRALERMRAQIQAMFAARERLMWDISHELRGPLARMAIAIPLLKADHGESAYLAQLERDVAAMDALVGEVLALAQAKSPESLAREPLDLAALAEAAIAERQLVLDSRALTLERALAPAEVSGDRRLLMRAIGNLIDNAIKYTPDPGRLRVTTGSEGGRAFFRLEDSGPGIAPEDLPRIFDPFFRPDTSRSRETGGTGLGLAIAKSIAETHGGELTLASTPGHGTTATLRLP